MNALRNRDELGGRDRLDNALDDKSTLGGRLKELRGERTQKWLADRLGIPSTTLSNYENNKSELNFAIIRALKTVFEVNTDWLLFGMGEKSLDESTKRRPALSALEAEALKKRISELEEETRKLEMELRTEKRIVSVYQDALDTLRAVAMKGEAGVGDAPASVSGSVSSVLAAGLPRAE